MNIQRVENMAGGKGHVIIKHILGDKEMHGNCRMYAEVTLEPGCSLGYHEHHGDRPVKAGDVTFTPDGHGHGLTNSGNEDLVFMALIIMD